MDRDGVARTTDELADQGKAKSAVSVVLLIDESTMVALLRESELMGDGNVDDTIRRRLTDGLGNAAILGPHDLRWRPVRTDAFRYELPLAAEDLTALDRWAAHWNYDRDVVIATLLSDEFCKPLEVAVRERSLSYARSNHVQREPGRGNIYPVNFNMAGYQLVFIRMLAGEVSDRALVLEEALLALAKQVVRGGSVLGCPVTEEAYLFAQRMVSLASKPSAGTSHRGW